VLLLLLLMLWQLLSNRQGESCQMTVMTSSSNWITAKLHLHCQLLLLLLLVAAVVVVVVAQQQGLCLLLQLLHLLGTSLPGQ
jgi:hypothetical protein